MIFAHPVTNQLLEAWPIRPEDQMDIAGLGGIDVLKQQIGPTRPAVAFTTPIADGSNRPLIIAGLVDGGIGPDGERRAELWSLPSVHIGFRLKSMMIALRRYLKTAKSIYAYDAIYSITDIGDEKAQRFIKALGFVEAPDFDFEAPTGVIYHAWKYQGDDHHG